MRALIDLGGKINTIHFTYTIYLGFYAKKIITSKYKIEKSYLDTFEIVIADYFVINKLVIHDYSINLLIDRQLFYDPIYILEPIELKILKTYS